MPDYTISTGPASEKHNLSSMDATDVPQYAASSAVMVEAMAQSQPQGKPIPRAPFGKNPSVTPTACETGIFSEQGMAKLRASVAASPPKRLVIQDKILSYKPLAEDQSPRSFSQPTVTAKAVESADEPPKLADDAIMCPPPAKSPEAAGSSAKSDIPRVDSGFWEEGSTDSDGEVAFTE